LESEERKKRGSIINEIKVKLSESLENKKKELEIVELNKKFESFFSNV
jgi:phenylalanyl-tRNA synthetase alpha subunit